MVSVLRSEDGSEGDLSLHVSDYDTDGDNKYSKWEDDMEVEEQEDAKNVKNSVIDDNELLDELDKVIGEEGQCEDPELVVKSITRDILQKYEKEDDKSNEDEPKSDSKDEEDLLLVLDEKAADEDADEYEMTMAEFAEEDSEEATLKDETMTSGENSKSPPVTEEIECKTDRNSPTDLMDIEDNVLDIGDNVLEIGETTEYITTEECEESNGVDNLNEEKDDQEKDKLDTSEGSKDDEEIIEFHVEVDSAVEKDDTDNINDAVEDLSTTEAMADSDENKGKNIGRVRPRKIFGTEKDTEISEPTIDDVDNKENVERKETTRTRLEAKACIGKEKKNVHSPAVVTKNLRKRVSAEGSDNEKSKKKMKTDVDSEQKTEAGTIPEKTDPIHNSKPCSQSQSSTINEIKELQDETNTNGEEREEKGKEKEAKEEMEAKEEVKEVNEEKMEEKEEVKEEKADDKIDQQTSEPIVEPESKRPKLSTESFKKSERKSKFRTLIADKSMTGLTRDTLEAFAVQKVCESIVYKSEIAALLKCIKDRDATIEILQKEVSSLNKQSKDLCIVHEKILQDLHRCMKQTDKPLLVPRITRSVGLQACTKDITSRKISTIMTTMPATTKTSITPQKVVKKSVPLSVAATTASPVQLTKVVTPSPKPVVLLQKPALIAPKVSPAKVPVRISPAKPEKKVVNNSTPKTNGGGAGVIDLTSDDDRRPQHPRLATGTKLMPAPQGHHLVVANGQQLMVKLPATQGNYLINNGGKVISTTASQASVLRPNTVNSIVASPRTPQTPLAPPRTPQTLVAPPRTPQTPLAPPRTEIAPRLKPTKVAPKKHPAPFPATPISNVVSQRPIPPRPQLSLSKTKCGKGIILSWKINSSLELFAEIASYQIYAYQETKADPRTENWSKVGDVKALQLPMAVTLTQFESNNRYYFSVRAVDILNRVGPFSDHRTIGN